MIDLSEFGIQVSDDVWELNEKDFNVSKNRKIEGLFCQGNGSLHLRASLEEHLSDAPQNAEYMRMPANVTAEKFPDTKAKWGTYLTGVYGKHPFLNNQIINLPNFLTFKLKVNSKEFDLEHSKYKDYQRSLNLRDGLLTHGFTWQTGIGNIKIKFERFVSDCHTALCLQRVTFESDRDLKLEVSSFLDADVRTNGFDHFREISFKHPTATSSDCRVKTDKADEIVVSSDIKVKAKVSFTDTKRCSCTNLKLNLKAGETLSLEKRSLVYKVDDKKGVSYLWELSFADLLGEQRKALQKRWGACDIEIDGNIKAQAAIRVSEYHLLRTAPRAQDISIDAKGYAGEGYFGRFFWDSEIYLLPYYLYTDEKAAKRLVNFRVNTLEGAKRNAKSYGYKGAKYAWESDEVGDECCPLWQYRDHEIHINADVLYALLHYAAVRQDEAFFYKKAKKMVSEVCRYWIDRIDIVKGKPSLVGVMGPDEYQPLSFNNAYTNAMVKFGLANALKHAKELGFSAAEVKRLKTIVDKLPIPRKGSLVLQSDNFEQLAEPDFERRWADKTKCYAAVVSQEVLYRSKNLKQADVLMLMYLFPKSFSDVEIKKAYNYYVPVTTHDSSLSCAIHSIIASRLNMKKEAWDFFERSAYIDLNLTKGGPAEGIHIAAAAGNWLVIMQGFLGMQSKLNSDVLNLTPRLPKEFKRIKVNFKWDGIPLALVAQHGKIMISNKGEKKLDIIINKKQYELLARATLEISLK